MPDTTLTAIAYARMTQLQAEANQERLANEANTEKKQSWFSRLTKGRQNKTEVKSHEWIEAGYNANLHSI